ncbi:DUF4345 domain-containing protein [Dyadobacter crusticola]|uniref:DUF4345 domain-containing protein n=1 Tax=Dyadobacter crusticola TaxID=292407 RepID=UPI0004E0EC17|nr:DUF4345 domain-containing protein [Dyadobacter crusticola]
MQTQSIFKKAAQGFILVSALALLSVSIMAFGDPQSVMDLVRVKLTNTDAFSSIRGVYGGVGMSLFITLIYLMFRDIVGGLAFLSLLWGFYALSRIVTIISEGDLGPFGQQWLVIESSLFLLAVLLLWVNRKTLTHSVNDIK